MAARQDPVPAEWLALAHDLAKLSGEILRERFRSRLFVESKADASPVSDVDRAVELRLREHLSLRAPQHGVRGEELDDVGTEAEIQWVLDPIDGTRSFVSGMPTFVTLIGLLREGRPVLGLIDQPIVGDRWLGAVGHGTRCNGETVETRRRLRLEEAWLGTTDPLFFDEQRAPGYRSLRAATGGHQCGGDGYLYGLLSSGHLDLVCEAGLALHDWTALVPVVEGAGGRMTDWSGADLVLGSGGDVIAAGTAELHAAALAHLK